MFRVKDKSICLLGARRSAQALCDLILRYEGRPKVSDAGHEQHVTDWARGRGLQCEQGRHSPEFVLTSDLIVLSPGVSVESDIVQKAVSENIPVLGEVEFSFQFCVKPVIAVTGSNGKTTVSTLIHETLSRAGMKSRLCGNIGHPYALYCDDAHVDYFVLEVSSFQSESLTEPRSDITERFKKVFSSFKGFQPFAAFILNFSENHLDRHKDLDDYFQAKTRLLINMTKKNHILLSEKSPRLKELAETLTPHVVFFDQKNILRKRRHKNPNYLAVYALADIIGIKQEVAESVMNEFKGVEHRLEWVRTLGGVDYINDSKSTTAEAGRWALNNVSKPVVLICGGKDKNIDFISLRELVAQKVKAMILFGEARSKLSDVFSDVINVIETDSLQDAVTKAQQSAAEGEAVVLSPMCASFDMFKDYEERGRKFKEIVQGLDIK